MFLVVKNLIWLKEGVYPYEYMNSFKRFKEDKLPDINYFFSSLKDGGIGEEENVMFLKSM